MVVLWWWWWVLVWVVRGGGGSQEVAERRTLAIAAYNRFASPRICKCNTTNYKKVKMLCEIYSPLV